MFGGLDNVTSALEKLGAVGDKVNAQVQRASGWTALGGLAGAGAGSGNPSSASAGSAAAAPRPSGLNAISGVVMVGGAALVALVVWAVLGRR